MLFNIYKGFVKIAFIICLNSYIFTIIQLYSDY
nr:MAG TPA: protein of unknown function (DUF5408) [Bacteriophage sp.]